MTTFAQMTYQETLDYLYAQLPMYHRVGSAAYKKDLTNTLALCRHLGNPEGHFASIHVGGTNGKGSVSHMLAAICQAAGLKTGLYISPHYTDFRERIKVNGHYIPRKRVIDFISRHKAIIEDIQPSFFELCVAMAFDHFYREKVDIAIIEVGLGGRLDSTNVITPLLSVITNISYDHMNLLGDTLALIAGEKAGIIKPGIPVVIGETHPESAPVFEQKALEVGAPIVFADRHFHCAPVSETPFRNETAYRILHNQQETSPHLAVNIAGPYQSKNLATVLQAVETLRHTPLPEKIKNALATPGVVETALANLCALTRFQGRWQWLSQRPPVLADSAHNEAGLRAAFTQINNMPHKRLHLVTGFVNDKDLGKALALFPATAQYYFAKADIPRGLEARELQAAAAAYGLHGRAYTSVRAALRAARRAAHPEEDLVVVIGSIFVVAEVLRKAPGSA